MFDCLLCADAETSYPRSSLFVKTRGFHPTLSFTAALLVLHLLIYIRTHKKIECMTCLDCTAEVKERRGCRESNPVARFLMLQGKRLRFKKSPHLLMFQRQHVSVAPLFRAFARCGGELISGQAATCLADYLSPHPCEAVIPIVTSRLRFPRLFFGTQT